MDLQPIRIRLQSTSTKATMGHWYLRVSDGRYLLSIWRKGKDHKAPIESADPQEAVDRLTQGIIGNMIQYLEQYHETIAELTAAVERGETPRPGFRPNYSKKAITELHNTVKNRVRTYRKEMLVHLQEVVNRGWPAPTTDPWSEIKHLTNGLID
jgi:hypothetical protein